MAKRSAATRRANRLRSCLGALGCFCGIIVLLLVVIAGVVVGSFFISPPFKGQRIARVLIVGLDEPPRNELPAAGPRRSDTILLTAVRLDGSGATLISVPRDARVRLPGHHRYTKINAAYAEGRLHLLRDTLAQPRVLDASLPYYFVLDSTTVRHVVDALGGVTVDVPYDMHYDDNWGNLHINLRKGRQRLTGEQAVGFLRWRKNNRGGGAHGDDFARAARQRELLTELVRQARTREGLLRLPNAYRALRAHSWTNLNLRQLIILGLAARAVHSRAVPATPRTIDGISYVICDWPEGRRLWQAAIGSR